MVHIPNVQPDSLGAAQETHYLCPDALHGAGIQHNNRYVLIPDRLILAFAHDPLAVGIYTAIARLCLSAKDSVPLAARDFAAWMGSNREADRVAIMRRIAKLEACGWLVITRTRANKHRLMPSWGRDQTGALQPWRFDQSDTHRPAHVRGRRVPLGLLDTYVGRLDPRPGQGAAFISRYFTQPLLDFIDIGVYVIGLRGEVAPTPRLRHLGLFGATGVEVLTDVHVLIERAAAGQLSMLVGDALTAVRLSVHGQSRLKANSPITSTRNLVWPDEEPGSRGRSMAGSRGRSHDSCEGGFDSAQQDAQNGDWDNPTLPIAWDVGREHERMNHDPSPNTDTRTGGGQANDCTICDSAPYEQRDDRGAKSGQLRHINRTTECQPGALAASVMRGHLHLNPGRALAVGEEREIYVLQERYGAEQLLVWQARAGRASSERPYGITPAYYEACAARAAVDAYRPTRNRPERDASADTASTPATRPDPDCDALLASMGVRERRNLGAVPYAVIALWQEALAHPGMAARCFSPIGFAVAQMQRGCPPPSTAELDRWAMRAHRTTDRFETWRCIEPVDAPNALVTEERALEARVRALVSPDADVDELCLLARALEAGASDAEALAQLAFIASKHTIEREAHSCA